MQSIKSLLDVNRNVEEHDIEYVEAFDFHIDDDDDDCMQEDEFWLRIVVCIVKFNNFYVKFNMYHVKFYMYHVKFENEHVKFDVTQVSTHPVKFDMEYVKFVTKLTYLKFEQCLSSSTSTMSNLITSFKHK